MSVSSSSRQPLPTGARRTVATFPAYPDAERAVDWLSDQGFAVERVSIVGTGLHYVEDVTGRVSTVRAALTVALQGAMLGLLFGLLFGLFFTVSAGSFAGVLLYGVVAGVIFGTVLSALLHSAHGGRRDVASVARTEADHYELQVDQAVADEAERLLSAMPSRG